MCVSFLVCVSALTEVNKGLQLRQQCICRIAYEATAETFTYRDNSVVVGGLEGGRVPSSTHLFTRRPDWTLRTDEALKDRRKNKLAHAK